MFKTTLCSNSSTKEFTFELPKSKKIGLYFSGGIDSSTLLCLMISQILVNNLDKEVYTFSAYKPTSDHLYADRLIQIISKHYDYPIIHQSNILNLNTYGRVSKTIFMELKFKFPEIEFYLAGNNMAPSELSNFDKRLGVTYTKNRLYHLPFIDLYKPHIIDLCYKIQAEFVLPFTHTCCVQAVGKCKNCYSCLERQWGFQYLGFTDIETIDL